MKKSLLGAVALLSALTLGVTSCSSEVSKEEFTQKANKLEVPEEYNGEVVVEYTIKIGDEVTQGRYVATVEDGDPIDKEGSLPAGSDVAASIAAAMLSITTAVQDYQVTASSENTHYYFTAGDGYKISFAQTYLGMDVKVEVEFDSLGRMVRCETSESTAGTQVDFGIGSFEISSIEARFVITANWR